MRRAPSPSRQRVAITIKPEGYRAATHFFNDESDVERLVEALRTLPRE